MKQTIICALLLFCSTTAAHSDLLVAGELSGNVGTYDTQTGAFLGEVISMGSLATPQNISAGPAGSLLISTANGVIESSPAGTVIRQILPNESVNAAIISPSGTLVIAVNAELREHSYPQGNLVRVLYATPNMSDIQDAKCLAGNRIAILDATGNGAILDYATGAVAANFTATQTGRLSPGPNNTLFVSRTQMDDVIQIDAATGALIRVFAAGAGLDEPLGLAVDPATGDLFVVSRNLGTIFRFEAGSGTFVGFIAPSASIQAPSGMMCVGPPTTGCTFPTPGDLDADGKVQLNDLAELLANFGEGPGAARDQGDLDGDGFVALSDLALLLTRFGERCGGIRGTYAGNVTWQVEQCFFDSCFPFSPETTPIELRFSASGLIEEMFFPGYSSGVPNGYAAVPLEGDVSAFYDNSDGLVTAELTSATYTADTATLAYSVQHFRQTGSLTEDGFGVQIVQLSLQGESLRFEATMQYEVVLHGGGPSIETGEIYSTVGTLELQ